MSESLAALWAALIGALSALVVGGIAYIAALKQVTKTANSQRQQAFWQLRRDTYAKYLLAIRNFSRVAHSCATHLENGEEDFDGVRKANAAAEDFLDISAILEVEAPSHPTRIHPITERCQEYTLQVLMILEAWLTNIAEGGLSGPASRDEFDEFHRILNANITDARDAFRDDLHRDIGARQRSISARDRPLFDLEPNGDAFNHPRP